MEEKTFTKIMVETKEGVIVNITALPKEQYEYFLELMHNLRLAYIAIVNKEELKKRVTATRDMEV